MLFALFDVQYALLLPASSWSLPPPLPPPLSKRESCWLEPVSDNMKSGDNLMVLENKCAQYGRHYYRRIFHNPSVIEYSKQSPGSGLKSMRQANGAKRGFSSHI